MLQLASVNANNNSNTLTQTKTNIINSIYNKRSNCNAAISIPLLVIKD